VRGDGTSAYFERELVHGMDLVEVVEHEVEQRGAHGDRPVRLSRLVDLRLGQLGLLHLLLDLHRRPLRRLEILDEVVVAEEVALGGRQARQQRVLERLERDLELVLLVREVRLELLEVRPLLGDDGRQQLLFQSVARHREVDERRLRLHLRLNAAYHIGASM